MIEAKQTMRTTGLSLLIMATTTTIAVADPKPMDGASVRKLLVGHTMTEPDFVSTFEKSGKVKVKSNKKGMEGYNGNYRISDSGELCITNPRQTFCNQIMQDGKKYFNGKWPILSIK